MTKVSVSKGDVKTNKKMPKMPRNNEELSAIEREVGEVMVTYKYEGRM